MFLLCFLATVIMYLLDSNNVVEIPDLVIWIPMIYYAVMWVILIIFIVISGLRR